MLSLCLQIDIFRIMHKKLIDGFFLPRSAFHAYPNPPPLLNERCTKLDFVPSFVAGTSKLRY